MVERGYVLCGGMRKEACWALNLLSGFWLSSTRRRRSRRALMMLSSTSTDAIYRCSEVLKVVDNVKSERVEKTNRNCTKFTTFRKIVVVKKSRSKIENRNWCWEQKRETFSCSFAFHSLEMWLRGNGRVIYVLRIVNVKERERVKSS